MQCTLPSGLYQFDFSVIWSYTFIYFLPLSHLPTYTLTAHLLSLLSLTLVFSFLTLKPALFSVLHSMAEILSPPISPILLLARLRQYCELRFVKMYWQCMRRRRRKRHHCQNGIFPWHCYLFLQAFYLKPYSVFFFILYLVVLISVIFCRNLEWDG